MIAFKFLCAGAVGPFSGLSWPPPGAWVDAGPDRWVSACAARHLPFWIQEELWEVELAGGVVARRHKVRAPRGRLVGRIHAWTPVAASRFARACAERADAVAGSDPVRRAMAGDAARRAATATASGDPRAMAHGAAVCGYIAAATALRAAGVPAHDAERARQVAWLTRDLGVA